MKYSYKIEFGFGAEIDRNKLQLETARRQQAIKNIRETATQLFGGCTMMETVGSWKAPDGHIYRERGGTVIVYVEINVPWHEECSAAKHSAELAQTIKTELDQEAIALVVMPLIFSQII